MDFFSLKITDLIDILIVGVLMYQIYKMIKGTNAFSIFIGIFIFYMFWITVRAFKMELLSSIMGQIIGVGVIALIIVFQQEIRRLLIYFGNRYFSKFGRLGGSLGGDESERARKLDLLEYQINEIKTADLREGEYQELKSRQQILPNVEKIMSAINEARNILGGDGGCGDGLVSSMHALNGITAIDDSYLQIYNRLEGGACTLLPWAAWSAYMRRAQTETSTTTLKRVTVSSS